MVPTYTTIEYQLTSILIVKVQTKHLCSCQTLTAHTKTATATAKTHIIHVVGTGHQHHGRFILHPSVESTGRISAFSTDAYVIICHEAPIHTRLNAEVEHRLLFTVFDTTDTSKVTLLIVCFDAVDDVTWQIFHGGLRVTRHKLLTVDHYLLDLLTINFNGSVITDLSSRQALHQLFNDRALWRTECSGIIYKGVGLKRHLGSLTGHRSTLQHDGVGFQRHRTQRDILVTLHFHTLSEGLKAHTRHLHNVVTCLGGFYAETSVQVGYGTRDKRTVCTQQPDSRLGYRLLRVAFYYLSCHVALCHGHQNGHQ